MEFERLEGDQIAITALDDGLRQSARGQSRLVYALGEGSGNPTPFQSPVVGCEGYHQEVAPSLAAIVLAMGMEWGAGAVCQR